MPSLNNEIRESFIIVLTLVMIKTVARLLALYKLLELKLKFCCWLN